MTRLTPPDPFLTLRVHDLDLAVSGLCVGYERDEWRTAQLARHVMAWLPEFCLSWDEIQSLGAANSVDLLRKAAASVYQSQKFAKRGEFGELLLHIAVRQTFGSLPAVSKIYYKTSANDTVKGFDAVHVVEKPDGLELWLGEAKFYSSITHAIRDAAASLRSHTGTDYLRSEFTVVLNMLDASWPHANELEKLLNPNTSLDQVFARLCIPVLLTYDSPCVGNHKQCDEPYIEAFEAEIQANRALFAAANLPDDIAIHLFLMPLWQKQALAKALDAQLRAWREI